MLLVELFHQLFPRVRAKARAKAAATEACRALLPMEPILGTWICADETDRYVVRVFCGHRPPSGEKLPPWRECVIFAVTKDTHTAQRLTDDEQYRPVIR